MKTQTLNGEWLLHQAGDQAPIPAAVPGCVHMDLLAAGLIEDPFYRDNEKQQMWVGETDWTYQRTFEVSSDLLAHEHILLRCHGLDTLAVIHVNGEEVGRTDNMFRVWEFDLRPQLREGENTIEVHFAAPMPYLRQQEAERGVLPAWGIGAHRLNSGAWLRKEPCNFGWDWGPQVVTSGIWGDIELVAYDTARLADVLILQEHDEAGVTLAVRIQAEQRGESLLSIAVTLSSDGVTIADKSDVPLTKNRCEIQLPVENPRYWWPNGMGEQPLYDVTVSLYETADDVLDTVTKRIGLRTLKLERHPDEWGESFYFSANGVPFFAKGANWIPADTFAPRLTAEDYEHLIADAADANMNMLRVWGGGVYEADVFYELCDRYGIIIWQDFMFACGTYPAYDAEFMLNVKAEAEDNVRRIRHHPCLALWCGNNELEQGLVGNAWTERTMSWEDYAKLFDVLLPDVVAEHDPQRDYWPGSPHTPVGKRSYWADPASGDVHLWGVWHQREPFEWYRDCHHRFVSEFGLQSFPEPKTVHRFTLPDDRNITSYVMEYHQRSRIGNSTIIHYLLDWFRLPTSFEATLWLSQVLQGMAMKYAVEHWRRHMPRSMGALYWQLNDCWPGPTWSSIDYRGRWKALHYMAKRFYAPLLISGLEDVEQGTVTVHITNDYGDQRTGTISWRLTDTSGTLLDHAEMSTVIPPRQSAHVHTLHLAAYLEAHTSRDLLLWLEFHTQDGVVSDNLVLLARPKHLTLHDPHITVEISEVGDGVFDILLESDRPTLYVWLEVSQDGVRFSDNFFHLGPARQKTIRVTAPGLASAAAIRDRLTVRSLLDTYR